jgi:hypothetical protein
MDEPTPVETDQVDVDPQQHGITDEPSFTDNPPAEDDAEHSRYKEMQADYTRKTQELASQRQEVEARAEEANMWRALHEDPDFQRKALEELGYEVPEEEPHYEPEYTPDPRVDQLMAAEQQRRDEALNTEIYGHIQDLEKESGIELPDFQKALLLNAAVEEQTPSRTEEIFHALTDDLRAQQAAWEKQWLASKNGVPHVSAGGQEGSQRLDISDRDERIRRFAAIADSES